MTTLFLSLALSFSPQLKALNAAGPADAVQVMQAEREDFSAAWKATLLERRQSHIVRLKAYSDAGEFPLNLSQPGLSHQFMDNRGVRCAMAELIWQSGHEDLVQDVATMQNDLVIANITEGEVLDWVHVSGMTMAEVAFVQEPGFDVSQMDLELLELTPDPQLLALEVQRRQAHFGMAAIQLERGTERAIELAMTELGERIYQAPSTSWSL